MAGCRCSSVSDARPFAPRWAWLLTSGILSARASTSRTVATWKGLSKSTSLFFSWPYTSEMYSEAAVDLPMPLARGGRRQSEDIWG